MTRNNTDTAKKASAVFFSAIMVLSMMAVGFAGFAGTAAAAPAVNSDYNDFNGNGIETSFQGQEVFLTGSALAGNEGELVTLKQVEAFNDSGSVVASSSTIEQLEVQAASDTDFQGTPVPGNDVVVIDTEDLGAGDYFITASGSAFNSGELPSLPDRDDTFEVQVQSLSAAYDDDPVTDEGADSTTDLDLESDRLQFSLNVSADGRLDERELARVFANQNSQSGIVIDVLTSDTLRNNVTSDVTSAPVITTSNASGSAGSPNGSGQFNDINGEAFGSLNDTEKTSTILGTLNSAEFTADERARFADALNDSVTDDPNPVRTLSGGDNGLEVNGGSNESTVVKAFNNVNPYNAFVYSSAEEDSDEKIALSGIKDTDTEVDFTNIDGDDYEFQFSGADTESSTTASITVREEDQDAEFSQGVYTQTAGDIVEVTVALEDTDTAFMQFGGEEVGFFDVFFLDDDDGDGEVTFQINTRTLGTNAPNDRVLNSADDIALSLGHQGGPVGGGVGSEFDSLQFFDESVDSSNEFGAGGPVIDGGGSGSAAFTDGSDTGIRGNALDIDPLERPLQPAEYTLAVSSDDGNFLVNEDDNIEVDEELDSASLELTQPTLGEVTAHTASEESADDANNIDDLLSQVTVRDEIAEDDRLVLSFEASGLYGAMVEKSDSDFDILEDGVSPGTIAALNGETGEGITIEVEAEDAPGNLEAKQVDFANANDQDVFTYIDNDAGVMYLVVDTGAAGAFNRDIDPGDVLNAEIEYEAEDPRYSFRTSDQFNDNAPFDGGEGGSSGGAAYPYLNEDADDIVTTSPLEIVEPSATFDNLNADDAVQLVPEEAHEVTGTTNLAPGSDSAVRFRSVNDTSPSFVITQDTTIQSDGSFSVEADFSDQSAGNEANSIFRANGQEVSTTSSVFVDQVGTETPTEEPTPTPTEEPTPTPTEEPTPTPTEEPTPTPTPTPEDTPGFGALVALVALIAAALLAARRND